MRSFRLLALVVLAVVLVLCSTQGALATIISASLDPECGPPGTSVTLIIRFTGSFPTVQTYPDLGPLGGDVGEGVGGAAELVVEEGEGADLRPELHGVATAQDAESVDVRGREIGVGRSPAVK